MKNVIYFLLLLVLASSVFAIKADSTNYRIYYYHGSASVMGSNTSEVNLTAGMGQTFVGNLSTTNYNAQFGIFYMRNITAADVISPTLTVTSPTATTYSTNNIVINFTAADASSISSLWYYNGTANRTNSSETITLSDGSYTFIFYANDTSGNTASESISFTVDTSTPPVVAPGGGGGRPYPTVKYNITPRYIAAKSYINKDDEVSFTVQSLERSSKLLVELYTNMETDVTRFTIQPTQNRTVKVMLNNTVGTYVEVIDIKVSKSATNYRLDNVTIAYNVVAPLLFDFNVSTIINIFKSVNTSNINMTAAKNTLLENAGRLSLLFRQPLMYLIIIALLILTVIVVQQTSKYSVPGAINESSPVTYTLVFVVLSGLGIGLYFLSKITGIYNKLIVMYNHTLFFMTTANILFLLLLVVYQYSKHSGDNVGGE
ncbi:MAG: hypothetical protein GOV02_03805 [Candidatus Aenigmarchaeota archaeon]|nr:hypothetical protein [Candidatus Aenigmarchaeota archaeon]